jgi:hypothetical protein
MRDPVFSLDGLYRALDEARTSRGLTWSAAVREMSAPFTRGGSRPLAVSTVTGLRTKAVADGDGVLQMLRWLGRSPESFAAGASADAGTPLPSVAAHQVLRFDTRRLHAALHAARAERGFTWSQAADAIGGRLTAASLTHLSKGGRTGFPEVMRMTRWLDAPVARFVRITSR